MARPKRTAEDQLLQIVNDLGWEKTEYLLNIYKSILKPKKKGLRTDPNSQAETIHTNEGESKTTPTE